MYYTNFAFFWVGQDTSIPQYLVKSINKTYSGEVKIYMLTDRKTPFIEGVTKTIRTVLPKSIMLARLLSYSLMDKINDIVFLDADSLVVNKISKIETEKDLLVFKRDPFGKFHFRNSKNEEYPEFINKNLEEVMPYLFGVIITHDVLSINNFKKLVTVAKSLPERFHTWFADQYSLKIAIDEGLINADIKNFSDFFQIISTKNSSINKPVITFKGPQSKVFIKEYFDNLCS